MPRLSTTLLTALAAAALAAPAPATSVPATASDAALRARVMKILKTTPLIDGHNDLPGELAEKHGFDVAVIARATDTLGDDKKMMTDLGRLKAGAVGGQFWSVYIDGKLTGDLAIRRTLEQIDIVRRMIAAHPGSLAYAGSAADIVAAHKAGRVASLIGVEGGRQMGDSMAALRAYHALGARYMTLTHNQTNSIADAATDQPVHGGLSPFGRAVVAEMNRLGMMVDLSHVAATTMRAAIAASAAPVIFSHSSAFALDPHPRNVPDDVLASLKAKDGVVMVNAWSNFLDEASWRWDAEASAETARQAALHPADKAAAEAAVKRWADAHPRPRATLARFADHIDHVAKVAGHDHVGIGADLDGIPFGPTGFDGVEDYPALLVELARRGWTDAQLAALAGGNILRVMRKTEAVAARMAATAPSLARPD